MAQFMTSAVSGFGGMQGGYGQTAPANVQWTITPQERSNYDTQFNTMQPVAGFLRGDQARSLFLQSQLPPQVLAQIWALADITGDGKMDKFEFAIAMKLIKLKLQGVMLPAALPASMKQTSLGGFGGTSLSNGVSLQGVSSTSSSASVSRNGSFNDGTSRPSSSTEWSVPKQVKLKYTQLFNTNDRTKSGYLSGMQARHILSGTGLPQMTLAKIWHLSDIDNDGKLSQDEFILAMHLGDTAKAGNTLPTTLPAHLIPPSYRTSAQAPQTTSMGQLGLLTPLSQMDPNLKSNASSSIDNSIFTTFEDKRRDNFQKGNLELEKRRLALLESQQKEKERLEQKERAERERKEKERMEQERKRQEELERQLERQREAEREREEHRRKAIEQKEAAQREMERQRQVEWERSRRKELLQHKLREQELVTSLRAKTKTLDVELSSHQEKRSQLQDRVRDVESRVKEQTGQLNAMNKQRELKHTLIQKQQEQIELFNLQLNGLLPEKINLNEKIQFKGNTGGDNDLQVHQRDYQSKVFTLQSLRTRLQETEASKATQSNQLDKLNAELNHLREEFNKQRLAMENMNRIQQDKLRVLQEARRQKDITLIRKSSIEEKKKKQEKLAAAAFLHKQKSEARKKEEDEKAKNKREEEARRTRELEQQQRAEQDRKRVEEDRKRAEEDRKRLEENRKRAEEDRKRAAEEAEKTKKQEEEELKRKAEDEAKKAEVKRKIMMMQEERRRKAQAEERKQQQPAAQSTTSTDGSTARHPKQGRGFQLVLSKDPAHLVKYRALYKFSARNPDELSIDSGDVILVDTSQDAEPDWLAGSKNNQSGWFPANYVEKLPGPSIRPPPQSAKPTAARSNTPSNQQQEAQPSTALVSSQQSAFSAATKTPSPSNVTKPPEVGQRYRAIYPWIAKKENHLTFDKDDIVAVSEKQEMWWFGYCKGKSGWFPKSYVKDTTSTTPVNTSVLPSSPKSSPVLKRKAPAPPSGGSSAARNGQLTGHLSVSQQPPGFIASYAFAATEPGDLSFNAGDVIMVTNTDGEWWTGTLGGKSGIFPANYVTPHKEEQAKATTTLGKPEVATVIAAYQATGSEQLSLQVGQVVSVRKKNESGWWEGELQARGKKKQIGWFPANYVKLMSSGGVTPGKTTPVPEKAKPTPQAATCRVMAMYDYSAQNADELTFQRGAVITVDDKSDPDWWKGTLGSTSGLFPSNYVQEVPANRSERSSSFPKENEYQQRVMELISSEEVYLKDLQLADESFQQPVRKSNTLTEQECNTLFVNLNELVMISAKLVKAFRVRCKMRRDVTPLIVGDILCEQIPHLHPYIRFCSCQLNASSLLQEKLDNNPDFKALVKKCESGDAWKGLPVSSYLVKPMQRVTKYPLLIKKIIQNTTEDHPDHNNLTNALEKAEELCVQVNEGVRLKENSDRLEWLQTHVQLEGLNDPIFLNEVLTRLPTDASGEEPIFHLSHIEQVYTLRAENVNERTAWMNKIREAADLYIDTEKKKREKAYQARTQRSAGIGRLVVTIVEGCNLAKTSNGRHDPYCEVTMGEQSHTTKTVQDTLNPKWGSQMQFFVKDISLDVVCISVFQRFMFSPDDFLGRTEVKLADVHRDVKTTKGPVTKRFLLHEVDAGEVVVKLDLLLFEQTA